MSLGQATNGLIIKKKNYNVVGDFKIICVTRLIPEKNPMNIIKSVKIPSVLDDTTFDNIRLSGELPWTVISQKLYGTIRLWWLLCVTNKILNPVIVPEAGTIIKVIKPTYVRAVIDEIKGQIHSN